MFALFYRCVIVICRLMWTCLRANELSSLLAYGYKANFGAKYCQIIILG